MPTPAGTGEYSRTLLHSPSPSPAAFRYHPRAWARPIGAAPGPNQRGARSQGGPTRGGQPCPTPLAPPPVPPSAPPRAPFLFWPHPAPPSTSGPAPSARPRPVSPPRALSPCPPLAPPSAPPRAPSPLQTPAPPRVPGQLRVSSRLSEPPSGGDARELPWTARCSRVTVRRRPLAAARGCWWWAVASRGWVRRRGSAATRPFRTCGFWRPRPAPVAASARSAASVTALPELLPGTPSRTPFPEPNPCRQSSADSWLGLRPGLSDPEPLSGPLSESSHCFS